MTKRRLTMSAIAPAGNVKRKNGAEAAVAMRERASGEAPRSFINQVAAMSWEETTVPANKLASHKRQNIVLRSANQVEVDFMVSELRAGEGCRLTRSLREFLAIS
jgi:hypothetical protein